MSKKVVIRHIPTGETQEIDAEKWEQVRMNWRAWEKVADVAAPAEQEKPPRVTVAERVPK